MSANSITNHEKHCTGNINRTCSLCEYDGFTHDLPELVKYFNSRFKLITVHIPGEWDDHDEIEVNWIIEPVTLEEIKKATDNCPNCTLAILRLTGMNRYYFDFKYDYKKEMKEWWNDRNSEQLYNFYHPE